MPIADQLSPELVLVDAELRAAAIGALPDRVWETYATRLGDTSRRPSDPRAEHDQGARSALAAAVLYTAWHALLGAVLASGAVLAVALMLLALGFATS